MLSDVKNAVVFSLLCRLPQCFLLKIFFAVSDNCMPAWPIWCYFLRISQRCLYSKIFFNISLKRSLHSPCNGHSTMSTLLQSEFWWAEHVDMRMSAGSRAIVWIMDTDIHYPHVLSSAELWCSKHGFTTSTVARIQGSPARPKGRAGILRNSYTSTRWEYVLSRVLENTMWCVNNFPLMHKTSKIVF